MSDGLCFFDVYSAIKKENKMSEMINFLASAIGGGVVGNAAYDGIKAIIGTHWARISPLSHDTARLQAELECLLQEHQDIKQQLQHLYTQSQTQIHIETVKGVGVNYGTINQNIS